MRSIAEVEAGVGVPRAREFVAPHPTALRAATLPARGREKNYPIAGRDSAATSIHGRSADASPINLPWM